MPLSVRALFDFERLCLNRVLMSDGAIVPAAAATPSAQRTPLPPAVGRFHLYFQFATKVFFTAAAVALLIAAAAAIAGDVRREVEEQRGAEERRRTECRAEYDANRCGERAEEELPPYLREFCWKKRRCAEEASKFVSKTRVTVKFVAHLLNEFINPLSPKTLVTIALLCAIVMWIPK